MESNCFPGCINLSLSPNLPITNILINYICDNCILTELIPKLACRRTSCVQVKLQTHCMILRYCNTVYLRAFIIHSPCHFVMKICNNICCWNLSLKLDTVFCFRVLLTGSEQAFLFLWSCSQNRLVNCLKKQKTEEKEKRTYLSLILPLHCLKIYQLTIWTLTISVYICIML